MEINVKNISDVKIREATNADCDAVQNLVFGVLREFGLEPEPTGTDRDLTNIKAHYLDRGGTFELLETEEGKLVGTVGLYPMNDSMVELRKMYFASEIRGKGIGRAVIERTLENARQLGFTKVYLETANVLEAAIHLYESFGFQPTCEKHTPRCDRAFSLELKSGDS